MVNKCILSHRQYAISSTLLFFVDAPFVNSYVGAIDKHESPDLIQRDKKRCDGEVDDKK